MQPVAGRRRQECAGTWTRSEVLGVLTLLTLLGLLTVLTVLANTTNTTETTPTLPQRYQNYRLPPSITTGTIPNRDSDASRLVRARHGISSLGFRDFSPLLCPVQSPGYMNIGGEVGCMILALPLALPRREIRDVCLTWSLRG